jgi:hypothetical protein
MAVFTGSPYNSAEPGCLYLVPVHATISTQTHYATYFEVHESHHMVVKKLIEGGEHVKGTHTNPELRKKSKKQDPALRKKYKKRVPYGLRGKYKKQDPALRKKPKKYKKYKKQDLALRKTYTFVKRKRRKV